MATIIATATRGTRQVARCCKHVRLHSSLTAFHPTATTSAHTETPYADPTLASAPYLPSPPSPSSPSTSSSPSSTASTTSNEAATTETPSDLTPEERRTLEEVIRVDQAGELGANYIYRGQMAILGLPGANKRTAALVQDMWDGEKKHIAALDKLVAQHGVRPTALYPLWKAAGFALGAGTALLGPRAAMACTEAVETVIGEHYDAQLEELSDPTKFGTKHPSIGLLKQVIEEFKNDELGHLETAVENEAQLAPAHALMSAVIATGCRAAIAISQKV